MAQEIDKGTSGLHYLYLVEGRFRERVKEGTPYAILRKYKDKDDNEKEKWELGYSNGIMGFIKSIEAKKSDFGLRLHVDIQDTDGDKYELQFNLDNGSFGTGFLEKARNIDYSKEVFISPYPKFTGNDGKEIREGISINQDPVTDENGKRKFNTKVNSFYWVEKKRGNGFPEPGEDRATYDSDDWKMYFIQVKKFLVSTIDPFIKPMIDSAELPF